MNMTEATSVSTPMVGSFLSRLDATGNHIDDAKCYRRVLGTLLYACHSCPDIVFSVTKLAQFMHQSREQHWIALKRVLRYVSGTLDYGLLFSASLLPVATRILAFADVDWARDKDDYRSMSGSCVFLGGNLVSWSTKKQKTVSRSTTEAEYRSIADVTAEVTWLIALLRDIGCTADQVPVVWSDSTSAVAISANPVYHARTKHVELDVHFVRERVARGCLQVNYVPAAHQIADGFTKPLTKQFFDVFRSSLSVCSLSNFRNGEAGGMLYS